MRSPVRSRDRAIAFFALAIAACSNGRAPEPGRRDAGRQAASEDAAARADAPPRGPRAIAIERSRAASYALLDDGTVRAWGSGARGELGGGAGADSVTPVKVPGVAGATELVVADASWDPAACARDREARWICWGPGDVLPGAVEAPLAPAPVAELDGTTQLAFGAWSGCALGGDGRVLCWGRPSTAPYEPTTRPRPPGPVAGLSDVVELKVGSDRVCVRRADGTVWCWGNDDKAQTSGEPRRPEDKRWVRAPRQVRGVTGAVELAVGYTTTCARLSDGNLACWGQPFQGAGAVTVASPRGARFEDIGGLDVCERLSDGAVRCLKQTGGVDCYSLAMTHAMDCVPDRNTQKCKDALDLARRCGAGELGVDPVEAPWVRLEAPPSVALSADHDGGCAVTLDGDVSCWGKNAHGQLGDGSLVDHADPRPVAGLVAGVATAPPPPVLDPAARTPAWDARPAACAMDPAIDIAHPRVPRGAMPVVSAFAEVDDYGISIFLADHPVALARTKMIDVRGDQRAVDLTVTRYGKGEYSFLPPTTGTYRTDYKEGRAGRFAFVATIEAHAWVSFQETDPRLDGTVTISHLDDRWVCGTIALASRGGHVRGRFAAERADF